MRLACALWLALGAAAEAQGCRLALLLALDVSSSVDAEEYLLQRDGVAAALMDPVVRSLILDGPGPVALAAYEWSGRRQSAVVLDWQVISDAAALDSAVRTLRSTTRSQTRFPTAMGYALGYGATLLRRAPDCARQVIDVSGDGITNDGFGPALAYKHFPFDGVQVNGLAVLGADPQVEAYYRDEVRHGQGAFVETAQGYAGYRRAMIRKLERELGARAIGAQ